MTKRQSIPLAQKKLISLLFIVIIIGGGTAYAEVLDCEIGDKTRGQWIQVPMDPSECRISGPPAADSPWPTTEGYNARAHVIEGRYLLSAGTTSSGWHNYDPPSGPGYGCITGFADASAANWVAQANLACQANPYCLNYTYSASGNLITQTYTSPYNSNVVSKTYVRFSDANFLLYEWTCNPKPIEPVENKNNQGPPLCNQEQ